MRPLIKTAFLDPFSPETTLSVMCEHLGRDGLPLAFSPHTIVHRAIARLREQTGLDILALGEIEYFVRRDERTLTTPEILSEKGYHASTPIVAWEGLRRQAMAILASIGVKVKYAHSEVGLIPAVEGKSGAWEQHEIELSLSPLPEAANAVVLTRWVLQTLAERAGTQVSFEPVVEPGHAGNGLHVHLALLRDGEILPVFDEKGELLKEAAWLIACLATVGPALMAFGNIGSTSLERLQAACEVPTSITWGKANRHALVRLPIVPHEAEGRTSMAPTIEFRLPDGSAQIHLLLAGIAQALCGSARKPDVWEIVDLTAVDRQRAPSDREAAQSLPKSCEEIADNLKSHRAVLEEGDVFPRLFIDIAISELTGK